MNFQDKQELLSGELGEAELKLARVALAHEQGSATPEDVAAAQAHVALLKARLEALEAARQEERRQIGAEYRAEMARKRAESLKIVDDALDDRRVAADKIEAAGALIAEAVALWTAADQAMVDAMRPHLTGEQMGQFRSLAFPRPRPDHLLLIGLIAGAGVPVSSINADFARRRVAEVSVNEMLLTERKRVRSFSDKLKERA